MKANQSILVVVLALAHSLTACDKATHKGHGAPEPAGSPAHEGHNSGPATSGHASMGAMGSAPAVPSGYVAIEVDPGRAASIGLATTPVELRHFERKIRTTGVVALDETRTSHVHAKVRGWVDRVVANFIGKQVKADTTLCTIYSQEVYSAQLEFLSVLDQAGGRPESAGPFAQAEREASRKLVEAARRRLALWDVPDAEVTRLEQTKQPQRTFPLVAPRSGIIISKQALPGMFIDPGTELYVVSDVSNLWVLADIYEADVTWVQAGATASLRIEGLEPEIREAKVAFVPPTIEETTRTLRVRFEVDNKDRRVRPGGFAAVEMNIDQGHALAIPESAVILAGDRAITFVVHGSHIEPRAIQLGPAIEGFYRVTSGVTAGERVATGAQFIIDSESRLRATSGPGAQHGGH
jgi:membrane fusion protein, copper/silver efflux system